MNRLEVLRAARRHPASAVYVVLVMIAVAGYVAENTAALIVGCVGAFLVWAWCEARRVA